MLSWLLCGSQNRPTMASTHRLEQVHHHLQMTDLPTFDELPNFKDFEGPILVQLPFGKDADRMLCYAGCAWEVWGRGDQLGTVNLLTDEVVARAAKEEIRYASLNLCFTPRVSLTRSSELEKVSVSIGEQDTVVFGSKLTLSVEQAPSVLDGCKLLWMTAM